MGDLTELRFLGGCGAKLKGVISFFQGWPNTLEDTMYPLDGSKGRGGEYNSISLHLDTSFDSMYFFLFQNLDVSA